jgi:hypothetical protein
MANYKNKSESSQIGHLAGDDLPDRRAFLRGGIAFASALNCRRYPALRTK